MWAGVDFAAPAPCRAVTDNAATRAFCDAAAHESGLAYRLLACVANMADEPRVTTRNAHAEGRSRDAITHLTGARPTASASTSPKRATTTTSSSGPRSSARLAP